MKESETHYPAQAGWERGRPTGAGGKKQSGQVRVVHIITRLILGGAQENTLLTVEGLQAKREYEVWLISGPALGPEGSLISRARANKVNLIIIPEMRRNIYPLKDAVAFFKLYRLIRKINPQIVHTHSSKAGFLGRLAAYLARVKVIVHTIHGLPFHPYQSKFINFIYILTERIAASVTHRIISVADAMTHQAVKAGVGKPAQYETIYSGLELNKFKNLSSPQRLRQELGIRENQKVIGTIARLFPLKGYDYLLKIAPAVIKLIPEVRFLFVGDGILKDKIISESRKSGIAEHIILAGLVNPERIPEMINIMDVLVHPSLREGLPRAVPQALALGKPVVAFDLDGTREVLRRGETGWLVTPTDFEQMTKDIVAILTGDKVTVQKMGERGRDLVYQKFDAGLMVEKINAVYQKLLAF
ncbi:MAG: glycosyltransferase family 4 protein [Planctomycetota bacterium]